MDTQMELGCIHKKELTHKIYIMKRQFTDLYITFACPIFF